MSYLEELLPEFRKGAKIRISYWYQANAYFEYKDNKIIDEKGHECFNIGADFITSDKWELYQEPIDYDYIIKNKCLCWFWDEDEKYGKFSRLVKIREKEFVTSNENGFCIMFKNCRPVRRDEVTFYEDRKDD